MSKRQALFNESIIQKEMSDSFLLSHVPDLERIKRLVNWWADEIKSGRIDSQKEESIKPKFLIDFFSTILGFRISGGDSSMVIELKTFVDGTKADAGLGHFVFKSNGFEPDQIYAVIEIKDSMTDLDESSKSSISAVTQAYEYAGKTEAKWIFVSNMKEIRFYKNGSLRSHDKIHILDLIEEVNLSRFLYLYHSVSVLNGIHKNIDDILVKSQHIQNPVNVLPESHHHIIDELYDFTNAFEGLRVLDPYYIANQKPFNILNQTVEHFEHWHIFTLNEKIYHLLQEISFSNDEIELSDSLSKECLDLSIVNPKEKLEKVFRILANSGVIWISAVSNFREIEEQNTGSNKFGFVVTRIFSFDETKGEGITKKIEVSHDTMCDCVRCTFNSFDFLKLANKVNKIPKSTSEAIEFAYGHYLLGTDKFQRCYHILKKCLDEDFSADRSIVMHFLIHLNLFKLKGPLSWYANEISAEILKDVKHLDLDRLIWDKFYNVKSQPVHKLLRSIKDEKLFERVVNKIDIAYDEMKSIYEKYKGGSAYISVPNYTNELNFNLRLIVTYATGNFLFYDRSGRFNYAIEKSYEGLILSHATSGYRYRFESFDLFTIRTAIIHIHTENLETILRHIKEIGISDKELKLFITLINSFFSQIHRNTLFGESEANEEMESLLKSHYFKESFRRIFSNIFIVSERIVWKREDWQAGLITNLTKFVETEDILYWFDLKKLARFIETKAHLFTYEEVLSLLEVAVDRYRVNINKYQHLIQSLCKCLTRDYPDKSISSQRFYQKVLSSSYAKDDSLKFEILFHIYPVVDKIYQKSIVSEAESILNDKFDSYFYKELLWRKILDWKSGNYFDQLMTSLNTNHSRSFITFKENIFEMDDVTFYNFCMLVHYLEIPLNDSRLKAIPGLSILEQWILNPLDFDYSQFNPMWVVAAEKTRIIDLLKGKKEVLLCIENVLKTKYDETLAKIYYTNLLP
ncbi:hypothetical protein SanaruYs_05480 [Chryseotalea sanaruensis]|uniref:Uncharacterized protein n=1 Tax=Chryseotalea sanaruensis TaxID=2482724 RepID=A0A401U5Y8_9BACT|nr:hypothetical protein [Chryseotalea sanaruensis]GCC50333.1 hypothetical protein SanaruYs_05480 [Chryseotalea sanaruensis]